MLLIEEKSFSELASHFIFISIFRLQQYEKIFFTLYPCVCDNNDRVLNSKFFHPWSF